MSTALTEFAREPESLIRQTTTRCLLGVARRDLHVLRRSLGAFIIRVTIQPLFFVFAFTYIFPKVGLSVGGDSTNTEFSALLVVGLAGSSMMMQGIPSVALPLIGDLGGSGEFEDRAFAPIPIWALAASRVIGGAVEGLITGLIVFLLIAFIPLSGVSFEISWGMLLVVAILAPVAGGALGLAYGSNLSLSRAPFLFAFSVTPMVFLGATHYPWAALDAIPWLKALLLLNPLLYVNESFRAAVVPSVPHMHPLASFAGLLTYVAVLWGIGLRGFKQKLRSD